MWTQALWTLLGAALSSAFTLGLAYLYFEKRYKPRLQREVDERVEDYLRSFRSVLDEEIGNAGKAVRKQVRQGVLDAVAALPSSEVIQETSQSAVQAGVDMVEAGIKTFLGGQGRKPRR